MSRALLSACCLWIATSVSAQPRSIARSIDELQRTIRAGRTVVVVDRDGREVAGTLHRIDHSDVVVTVGDFDVAVPRDEVSQVLVADGGSVAGSLLKWMIVFGAAGDLLVNRCVDSCTTTQQVVSAAAVVSGALYGRAEALRRRRHRQQVYVAPGSSEAAWPDLIAPGDELPGPALVRRVRRGDLVFVTDVDGVELFGSVTAIDDGSVTLDLRGRGTRRVEAERVRDVQRFDAESAWDGFAFGAVFGILSGLVIGDTCDDPGVGRCGADGWDTTGRGRLAGAAWQGTTYGVIGYLLDRARRRERIESLYRVVRQRPGPTVRASPVLAPGRASIHLAVVF